MDSAAAKLEKTEEEGNRIAEDELDSIMENFILDTENPDMFAQMNVANVGVNVQENQKVVISAIADNAKKSDDKYAHMKNNSLADNFPGGKCPYSTLDVVFNKRNVWFNRQHFNPAVVKFDF